MKALNIILLAGVIAAVVGLAFGKPYWYDVVPNKNVAACVDHLKENLSRPLSFQRTPGTTTVEFDNHIDFEYTAKNGFGNEIPGRASCYANDGVVGIFETTD